MLNTSYLGVAGVGAGAGGRGVRTVLSLPEVMRMRLSCSMLAYSCSMLLTSTATKYSVRFLCVSEKNGVSSSSWRWGGEKVLYIYHTSSSSKGWWLRTVFINIITLPAILRPRKAKKHGTLYYFLNHSPPLGNVLRGSHVSHPLSTRTWKRSQFPGPRPRPAGLSSSDDSLRGCLRRKYCKWFLHILNFENCCSRQHIWVFLHLSITQQATALPDPTHCV